MEKENYQFTQVPTNLFILLDNNCRSMLFTLIQLSSYYADEDGWFFRTCSDLEAESNLSQNLVKATLQTLFNHHIIEAKPTGQSKGSKPNYYKVNFGEFTKYEDISIEDAMKNPDLKIHTVDYKGSCFKLNLVRDTVTTTVTDTVRDTVTTTVKSDHNIDNIDNVYNEKNEKNTENENNEEIKEDILKKEFEEACESSFDWELELDVLKRQLEIASSVDEINLIGDKFTKLQKIYELPDEYKSELQELNNLASSALIKLENVSVYN